MAYLNCPECRLTVHSSMLPVASQTCPRCDAKLGAVSRLFRSPMPQRLVQLTKRDPARP